jgi:bifunctional pyridoxal-dependent enzyme with beta-cystathionase and maltose regulon repressor activities
MVSRVLRNDTVFRRMAELSDRADVPYISDEIRARLMRIARNRL